VTNSCFFSAHHYFLITFVLNYKRTAASGKTIIQYAFVTEKVGINALIEDLHFSENML